jgi:hypothetical protein
LSIHGRPASPFPSPIGQNLDHREQMFYSGPVSPLSRDQRQAMAEGLIRAADHFEERAKRIDETVMGWRKNRPNNDSPVIANTLHGVGRELRRWAERCRS